jgi:hypothetical protein
MSHRIGRMVPQGVRIGPDSGLPAATPGVWIHDLAVQPALVGGSASFVMLHFAGAVFGTGAVVKVDLGYDVDLFSAGAGTEFWSRPLDPARFAQSVRIIFSGPAGGVTLLEYGSGEPIDSNEFNWNAGEFMGSHSDPDVFLHNSSYVEPIFETRLRCHNPFTWLRAAAATTAGEKKGVAATGIIVMTETVTPQHPVGPEMTELSSCTGTLIGPDLFLTARHCASDANGADILSASVTFEFQTDASGNRPAGYSPRWYKVIGTVAAGVPPTASRPWGTDWLILRLHTGSAGIPITPCDLRSTAPTTTEPVFAAHHPGGAAKKFQRGTVASGDVQNVTGFDYAGGSSGSALFDANGKVIGAALAAGPLANACNAGYTRASSVTAALANPPVPGAPWDVMIVMDRSGSMSGAGGNGQTKLKEAKDAASLFVQLLRIGAGDMVGVGSFASTATNPPEKKPAPVTAAWKQTLVGTAPFTSGVVGGLAAGGDTSIGDGLKIAKNAFPAPHGGSRRAILLLTDGLQNTMPMVETVESQLAGIHLFIVGYGDDANLDGPLLTRLARDHDGFYVRADHGLAVRKFFGLSFGNIFQSGALADPEYHMAASETIGAPIKCGVCDETAITAIVGWDNPAGALGLRVEAPDGTLITMSSAGVVTDTGATWAFLRIALPFGTNRTGTWRITVLRAQDRRRKQNVALDYFVSVIADGGPKLVPLPPTHSIAVGDPLPVMVGLHYPDRTVPPNGEVAVTITGPRISIDKLVAAHGFVVPPSGSDPVNAWTATLQQIAAANGGTLPVPTFTRTVQLFDDGAHNDGAMEPDGVFAATIPGITKVEGTYDFHAVARYGSDCPATRETFWSITVGMKDDPYRHVVKRDRSSNDKPAARGQVNKTTAKTAKAKTKPRPRVQ